MKFKAINEVRPRQQTEPPMMNNIIDDHQELEDDPCNETNLDANDQSIQGEYNGNVMRRLM